MNTKHTALPVIILCGGQGTRMLGATTTKKELVEIGGYPILWHVMKIFATYGHTHFILTLGHQADAVKRYFLEYESMHSDFTIQLGQSNSIAYYDKPFDETDWTVTLADTGLNTEKGSRIYQGARYVEDTPFFVTYGDGVGNVDLDAVLAFHQDHGKLVTITGVQPYSQYGILNVTPQGQVTSFSQKPQLEHWINAGFMVFEPGTLDYMAGGNDIHLERTTFPRLAAEGQIMMYRHTGFWRSMDTFKEALELDSIWRQSAPWKVWK